MCDVQDCCMTTTRTSDRSDGVRLVEAARPSLEAVGACATPGDVTSPRDSNLSYYKFQVFPYFHKNFLFDIETLSINVDVSITDETSTVNLDKKLSMKKYNRLINLQLHVIQTCIQF